MKKKIIYGLLFAVAMVTASSSFVSCKDYEGDNYAELREQNASLKAYLDAQVAAIKQCHCDLSQYVLLTDLASRGYLTSADLNPYAKTSDLSNYVKTSDLAGAITTNSQTIIDIITAAGYSKDVDLSGYAKTSDLEGFLKASDLAGYAKTSDLEGFLKMADLVELGDSVKKAYTWALYSYTRTINQGDSLKSLYDSIDVVRQDAYDSITKVREEAFENFKTAKQLADSAIALANKSLDSCNILDAKIADLDSAMKAADAKLNERIDSLCEKLAAVEQDINNLFGSLKKQISGVIIQGTYSPVFGNGSLPLGIQTNILAAYAGKTTNSAAYNFPSYVSGNYFDSKAVITAEDYDFVNGLGLWPAGIEIPANEVIIDETDGNAGKMYLTVNPTNVDFSGTDFKLVNSQGQESRIQLSKLEASDEVLTWGWTRGTTVGKESANGFYEVAATVAKDDALKMQPRFDKAGFKAAVKAALDGEKRLAVKDAARALYNSLKPTDRFGVKAEWQDTVGLRSVTSAFDIAAMSIEPLGFGFKLPSSKYTRVPVINTEFLKNKFHVTGNVDPIVQPKNEDGKTIATVKIVNWEVNVDLSKVKFNIKDKNNPNNIIGTAEVDGVTYPITIDSGEKSLSFDVTKMYEDIYGQFNATLKQFNDIVGQVNNSIDYVISYVEKYNSLAKRVNNVLDNIGDYIQPVLVWSDGEKAGELSGIVSGNYALGTVVPQGGHLAIHPTSYSLELFAPAYQKSLIVTNAYKGGKTAQGGDAKLTDCVKSLNNEIKKQKFDLFTGVSLDKVFDFEAKTECAGVTFEIAYTAVDYEGKIAGRKFYVTVAE